MSTFRLFLTVSLMLLATYAFPASNNEKLECNSINCDCNSLPSETWKSICINKQNTLQSNCKKVVPEALGYCSIHGPGANRIPIKLNLSTSTDQSNSIKLLNYKFAAIYWSMYKDLDFIEASVNEQKYAMAEERLRILQRNSENLFEIQKNMVNQLKESNNNAEIEKSWRNFAEDTQAVTERLEEYADKLLASTQLGNKQPSANLGYSIIETAGDMYEQVGYSYSQGMRHKFSAQAWKKSASIASLLLSSAERGEDKDRANYYRYQAATRLHRASYNWSMGIDKEHARSALVESQNYMDDKSDLAPLLREGSMVSK